MSEAKHTPGPWVANCDIYPVMVYRVSEEMEFVANTGESKANARLIAAAPELLEALQAIMRCSKEGGYLFKDSSELYAARAAIAKATT